jgi:threonine dehydrogenase-like Zn-dependent dehydrogenase
MTKTIRAAVKIAPEVTEIQTFNRPPSGLDCGLLRVESSGVGGSDPEQYRRSTRIPSIMGHEIVGVIEELGDILAARSGFKVGDRVALEEYIPCWHCKWCLQGDYRLCEEVDFFVVKDCNRYGMTPINVEPHLWGGYAQYVHLSMNAVMHRVPDGLSAKHATLAIPFGNGFQWACLDGGAGPGKATLIFGAGQQGLGCVAAAKEFGAGPIILVGMTRDLARLQVGLLCGADVAVNSEVEDLDAAVMAATGGKGVEVVVDTTGDRDGSIAAAAVRLAAKGATLSLNGLGQSVSLGDIKKWYLEVRAPRGHSHKSIELALKMLASGRLPLDAICSHDFPLDQTHQAILATAGREIEGAVHVTVNPWA